MEVPDRQWELHHKRLREKPAVSGEHNDLTSYLGHLQLKLDRSMFKVRVNASGSAAPPGNSYLPEVAVVPTELDRALRQRPGTLDAFAEPLPLVVEVWSPSTGDDDVNEALTEYERRGDLEIWRLHPYGRTLTAWRRQAEGDDSETVNRVGVVRPVALPGVAIDIDVLFNL